MNKVTELLFIHSPVEETGTLMTVSDDAGAVILLLLLVSVFEHMVVVKFIA